MMTRTRLAFLPHPIHTNKTTTKIKKSPTQEVATHSGVPLNPRAFWLVSLPPPNPSANVSTHLYPIFSFCPFLFIYLFVLPFHLSLPVILIFKKKIYFFFVFFFNSQLYFYFSTFIVFLLISCHLLSQFFHKILFFSHPVVVVVVVVVVLFYFYVQLNRLMAKLLFLFVLLCNSCSNGDTDPQRQFESTQRLSARLSGGASSWNLPVGRIFCWRPSSCDGGRQCSTIRSDLWQSG